MGSGCRLRIVGVSCNSEFLAFGPGARDSRFTGFEVPSPKR